MCLANIDLQSRAHACSMSISMTPAQSAAVPTLVDFTVAESETTVATPPPERLLEGTPQTVTRNFFTDPTGQLFAGIWESTPGRWRVSYTETEFCHITRGSVNVSNAHGYNRTFKAGDSFVIPSGFAGVWHVLEPMSKRYVIFEVAAR